MSTWSSEADSDFPLVFVTRRGSAVDFWTIPFTPPELANESSNCLFINNAFSENPTCMQFSKHVHVYAVTIPRPGTCSSLGPYTVTMHVTFITCS